jgi:hypothetical protein
MQDRAAGRNFFCPEADPIAVTSDQREDSILLDHRWMGQTVATQCNLKL